MTSHFKGFPTPDRLPSLILAKPVMPFLGRDGKHPLKLICDRDREKIADFRTVA